MSGKAGGDSTLTPQAQRALKEAQERREAQQRANKEKAGKTEIGGRDGPDPARYGDWEKDGIVSDF